MPTPLRHTSHPCAARRIGAALVAVASIALAPGSARAEPPAHPTRAPRTSSLSWVRLPGAEACIGSRALAVAVERRLGREVFVPASRAAIAVEGRIERSPAPQGGFRAVITVSNEAGVQLGSREIVRASPSCAAMDDDLALVIAVMIDPEATLGPPLPAAPAPLPLPLPRPDAGPPACIAPPSWRVSLQAGGEAMLGLLPRVSGGVLIRSHVEPPRLFGFEVGGVLFPAVEAVQGTVGGSFQLSEAFVSACPLTLRAFGAALSPCAGVQAGAIHAVGFGFSGASSQEQGLFNVAIEGRVHRRLVGPLVAGAGLGLVIPVVRARFSYPLASEQELFTMAPVAGAVDLSLGVEFP